MSLCAAIAKHQVIRLAYSGYDRLIEPYLLGVTRKGKEMLRAYQIDGGSVSGETEGWKLFDISEAGGHVTTGQTFRPRPEYNPSDRAMREMICRL
jgi:hypothetical protein